MNVLLITADQHLATCLGHEGHPQVLTPHLDRLALQGMRFRHAYAQSPICTPSRTSLYSGQYCHNHGYFGLSGPTPDRLPSFFSHFKQHGYRTAGTGNLHVPNDPRNWLADHLDLFDDTFESVDGHAYDTDWFKDIQRRGLESKEDFQIAFFQHHLAMEGMPSLLPFELSQEGWCVGSGIRFMRGCGEQPFCLHVSFEKPHEPFFPDKRFWDMYPEDLAPPPTLHQDPSGRPPHFRQTFESFRRHKWATEPDDFEGGARRMWRAYLACITHVDHAVGLLLDYLDRSDLAKNTIVIYTADHGAYSGTHGIQEKAPGICSEAVCRIPSIWRVPGVTPAGAVNKQFVEQIDIAPTIASLCRLPFMETVDGCDITPLLRGGSESVRDVSITENVWSKSLRWKQWRFVHYQRKMFDGADVGELYDIERDPDETHNLYHDPQRQPVLHECRRLLMEWLIQTTRVKTVWPCVEGDWPPLPEDRGTEAEKLKAHQRWLRSIHRYHTAGDGKISNTSGALRRLSKGELNYL